MMMMISSLDTHLKLINFHMLMISSLDTHYITDSKYNSYAGHVEVDIVVTTVLARITKIRGWFKIADIYPTLGATLMRLKM